MTPGRMMVVQDKACSNRSQQGNAEFTRYASMFFEGKPVDKVREEGKEEINVWQE